MDLNKQVTKNKKPKTLNDINEWLNRSDMGWLFSISEETLVGLSYGVNIIVNNKRAAKLGVELESNYFVTVSGDLDVRYDELIALLKEFGVDQDWEDEPVETYISDEYTKPITLKEVEDWIDRCSSEKYSIIKMMERKRGTMISTYLFTFRPLDFAYALDREFEHLPCDYDEIINYFIDLDYVPDWNTEWGMP